MIKRRFYRLDHNNKDAGSSSSSSDSEQQPDSADSEEVEMEDVNVEESNFVLDSVEKGEASSSSGYETEGSSASEVNLDSSELLASDDDDKAAQTSIEAVQQGVSNVEGERDVLHAKDSQFQEPFDVKDCILKRKSVFKCKLCPKIVCLSEDTLKAHLNSKRHARSEKLFMAGRLKVVLNDDGQIEGEEYSKTHAASEGPRQQKRRGNRQSKEKKRSRRTCGRN